MAADVDVARFDRRVRDALDRCGMGRNRRLVVAVSGGPDSMALLYALYRIAPGAGLSLHGAHLNHGLRGGASDEDERYVASMFAQLAVPVSIERADVQAYRRERRLSLEQAARQVRYAFLGRVSAEQGADAVASGHTSDDQAETVLMHLIRGSGLAGLRGMEPVSVRQIGGARLTLLRPLLKIARLETAEYCLALNLNPRSDESNLDRRIARNRVRLELIPLLESFNPSVKNALVRLAQNAAEAIAYLDGEVDRLWPSLVTGESPALSIGRGKLAEVPAALRSHLLRRAVERIKGDLEGIEQVHIEDMTALLDGPAGRSLDLPGGLRFSAGYDHLSVARAGAWSGPPKLNAETGVPVPGDVTAGEWHIRTRLVAHAPAEDARREPADGTGYAPTGLVAYLDASATAAGMSVRRRMAGDRFQPLGMSEEKKLQDFFVDEKVPREWRDSIPLLLSGRRIAWVVGWRIAQWAVPEAGRPAVEVTFKPEQPT